MLNKILGIFGTRSRKIKMTFILHERDGGYTYITCQEFPGFTFMLEPGEGKDIRAFITTIHEPLMAFISAYIMAQEKTDQHPYA